MTPAPTDALREAPWKVALALGLAVLAIFLFARMLRAPATPPAPAQPAVSVPAQPAPAPRAFTRARRGAPPVAAPSLDPTLRLDLLRVSEGTAYEGKGRNIFRAEEERALAPIPQPVASPVIARQPEEARPAGPPPINLRFFGFASREGQPRQVFLSEGDNVYIAREGDIVGRRYRIIRIEANTVEVEDILNNRRQTIPLTQG